MKRFGYGFEFGLTTFHASAGGGEEPISELKWGDHGADITLSNGDLTATAQDPEASTFNVRANVPRSTGRHAFEVTLDFAGIGNDWEVIVGLVTEDYIITGDGYMGDYLQSWGFTADGVTLHNFVDDPDGDTPGNWSEIASGGKLQVLVDFDEGKIFAGPAGAVVGDPEAGTGALFTFTPNTPLYPGISLYSYTEDVVVGGTLTPGFNLGSYEVWGVTL